MLFKLMRYIFLTLIIISIISCDRKTQNNAGVPLPGKIVIDTVGEIGALQTYCLLDFLVGADDDGVWSIESKPATSTLTQNVLDTPNPCLDFNNYGCGTYSLKYLVKNPCCIKDSTILNLLLPCCALTGSVVCN